MRFVYPIDLAPDTDVLSPSDVECLDNAIAFCRVRGFGELSHITHQERAWREAPDNGPMDYEAMIEGEDREAIRRKLFRFRDYYSHCLFFWINTKQQRSGVGQFPLCVSDHVSLTRDCFLDCSRLIRVEPHEFQAAKDRGKISNELTYRIVDFLRTKPPKTLPGGQVRTAVTNLAALLSVS